GARLSGTAMSFLYKADPVRGAQWAQRFAQLAPDLAFRIWPDIGDPEAVRYLAAWQPPDDPAALLPNLEVVFSVGAGIDQFDLLRVPAHIPVVRMIEPGIVEGMVEYVTQAVRAGASGYLLKDSPASEIVRAIGAVLAGQTFFSEGLAARMIQASATASPLDRLTPRERDILDALAEGLSSKQIAQQTGLSVRTVETHRLNLKRKLEIEGQAELIKFAVEHRRR
ncbi:LuxR C-terminal-related transcriptional regulator, partial [Escherichia coli]|uniref:LuxR C-terminal-related transcriptional regulator n=1 Tax=Escherichia coli TaxID=562 RepID=UPI00202BAB08